MSAGDLRLGPLKENRVAQGGNTGFILSVTGNHR